MSGEFGTLRIPFGGFHAIARLGEDGEYTFEVCDVAQGPVSPEQESRGLELLQDELDRIRKALWRRRSQP